MKNSSTKKIVLNGLMIALVFIMTKVLVIPTGAGYFNVGDVGIMAAAIVFGRNTGFLSGAIGSALADVLSGYAIFAPITFLAKGLEGYIVGLVAGKEPTIKTKIIAVIAGALVMIAGYFVGEAFILGAFDKTFGWTYAVTELVGTNLLQGAISAVLGYVLSTVLQKAKVDKLMDNK